MVTLATGCYPPWVTAEDIERARDERQRAFRAGLRAFRWAVSKDGGQPVLDPH
jgi:hypothetical protein